MDKWKVSLLGLCISRAPLGFSITLYGYGIHAMLAKGWKGISICRPLDPRHLALLEELGLR